MTKQLPWEVAGNPWKTEGKFIVYLRGVLRAGWSRFPLKLQYIKDNRKRIKNPKPNAPERFAVIWGGTCECCNKDFPQAMMEIDHKGEQGKFTTMSEIEGYARHLFMVTYEDMRWICKPCHKIISHSQRIGSSFDEASLEKDIIEIMKNPISDIIDFIDSYGEYDISNEKKRKLAVKEILKNI